MAALFPVQYSADLNKAQNKTEEQSIDQVQPNNIPSVLAGPMALAVAGPKAQ